MGGSLIAFFQNALTLITGPLGILLMCIAIGVAGLSVMFGASMGILGRTIGGVAFLYGCAWIAQTLTGGGGF